MTRCFLFFMAIALALSSFAQDQKLVVISFDGYRWEDIFRGADSGMLARSLKGRKDSTAWMNRYWDKNAITSRKKLMPFLWNSIAVKGQIYGNRDKGSYANVTNNYWFSYPGYNEIFTGHADSTINSNDFGPNPNVTLLEWINKQKEFQNSVAAFTSWAAYNRILNKDRAGFPVNAGFTPYSGEGATEAQKTLNDLQYVLPQVFGPNERHDAVTYYLAKEYLQKNHPRVLYIAFIETDAYAHRDAYDMYLASGNHNDKMIEDLWNILQKDPFYKGSTTLMLVTDHGRGNNIGENWTHHNRKEPGSDQVWMAAIGPQVKAKGEMSNQQIYQMQYAQTMASILGLRFTAPHPVGAAIETVLK